MNIFLTGASGFIGQAVSRKIRQAGHSVTGLLMPQEPQDLGAGTAIVRGDVTKPESLVGLMKGADAVIHLAGAVGFQSWANCLAINRNGTANVVREAVASGVRRFVHMSSATVLTKSAQKRNHEIRKDPRRCD